MIGANPKTILEIATAIAKGDGASTVPAETSSHCRENAGRLADVPADRLRAELELCLLGRDVDIALQWLLEIGVIKALRDAGFERGDEVRVGEHAFELDPGDD